MAARPADELRLALAVGPLAMSATATSLTRMGRIDELDRHPRQPRLADDEAPELRASPAVESISLPPGNREPFADASQVFQGDAAIGAFGLGDEILADPMVDVPAV